jgi:hypothetical protein
MWSSRAIPVVALVALSAALGCEGGAEPPVAGSGGEAAPSPSEVVAERAQVVIKPVMWPEASAVDVGARGGLDETGRRAVDRSPVPVLLPAEPAWLATATVMSKQHWYALSSFHDGVSLALRGTRLAHRYPAIAAQRGRSQVRGQPAFVTTDRRIVSVAWQQYGVAYSLDLECAAPDDRRCVDGSAAIGLADELVFVGGQRKPSEPVIAEEPR